VTARVKGGKARRPKVPESPTEAHRTFHRNHPGARRCGTHVYNLKAGRERTETVGTGAKRLLVTQPRHIPVDRWVQRAIAKRRAVVRRRRANRVARRSIARNRRAA
jgi:hypothetical protein